jgi:hypothetical protein
MQSAIHRAAETPSQIRAREELKLRRARMSVKPVAVEAKPPINVETVPVVPDESAASKQPTEEIYNARWFERQERLHPLPSAVSSQISEAVQAAITTAVAARRAAIEAGAIVTVSIRKIIKACAQHYDVTELQIISQRREKEFVQARHVAMYLAKEMTPCSFPEIGRRFGNRDHTTVLHGVRKITRMLESDKDVIYDVLMIREKLA